MIGLVLKDLIALKKQGKILFILIAFYLVYSIMVSNISFLSSMVALLCAMLPITSIAYDEQSKWDKYALSMPVSRKNIVLSKYLLGLGFILVSMLVVIPVNIGITLYIGKMDLLESLVIVGVTCEIALIFISIMMPVLFKFGVEKGRIMMMLVIFVPTCLIFLLSKSNFKMPSEQTIKMLVYLSPLALIVILIISIFISLQIYTKKEF